MLLMLLPLRAQQSTRLLSLKVRAAEAAGLDTLQTFREELAAWQRARLFPLLTDSAVAARTTVQAYEQLCRQPHTGQWLIAQIHFPLSQNVTSRTLERACTQMDSLYHALTSGTADFDACVERYSAVKEPRLLAATQMPLELLEAIARLQPGELSQPFLTPQGIHIIKVLEHRPRPAYEALADRLTERYGVAAATDSVVERLKRQYAYTPNEAGIDELLKKGNTSQPLFRLGGKEYSGEAFAHFAASYPAGVRRQLEAFVKKTVLDCEAASLYRADSDFSRELQQYRTERLAEAITHREVDEPSRADTLGLQRFFEEHRADYHWPEIRFRGILLQASDKKLLKRARKFLKQLPPEEWQQAIRLTFNAGDSIRIRTVQGVFAPGDHPQVDARVFKGPKTSPDLSYPFTAVLGKKEKGPAGYREVRELVQTDYRACLLRLWEERLLASDEVGIDQ